MTARLANPTLFRWLPVIVLPPILLLDGLLSNDGKDVDALGVLFTYLAVLPLVWRARLRFFALAPLLVGGVVLVLWSYGPGTTVVTIPAWGLFELARTKGRRETIMAAIALPPCVLVSIIPFAHDGAEMVSVTLRNLALCELALAVGYLMWHNRAALEREVAAHDAESQRRLGDERLRIAREVHDVVAHAMVAINVQAGVAAHLLDQDTEQAREALLHIKRTSGDALTDLRATLGVLRDPDQAAPVGPAAGLEDLEGVAAQLRAAGVEVTVDVDTVGPVPTPVHSAGYRIVQEALDERAPSRPRAARRRRRAHERRDADDRRHRRRDRAGHARQRRRRRGARDVRAGRGARRRPGRRADARRRLARRGGAAARARPDGVVTRVLLADDQGLVRAGFKALLSAQRDIDVVGEAADGTEAVALARAERPDIVLMDVRMPRMDGLEATRRITADAALDGTRVIVLTTFELDEYVFGALRAGASGFLLKDIDPPDLLSAVRIVAGGDALLAPRLTRRLIEAFVGPGADDDHRGRRAGRADAARAGSAGARRPRVVERRDRRRARALAADGEDARGAAVPEARRARPGPARRRRLRVGPGRSRRAMTGRRKYVRSLVVAPGQ